MIESIWDNTVYIKAVESSLRELYYLLSYKDYKENEST